MGLKYGYSIRNLPGLWGPPRKSLFLFGFGFCFKNLDKMREERRETKMEMDSEMQSRGKRFMDGEDVGGRRYGTVRFILPIFALFYG
jgi:hypothetical protein